MWDSPVTWGSRWWWATIHWEFLVCNWGNISYHRVSGSASTPAPKPTRLRPDPGMSWPWTKNIGQTADPKWAQPLYLQWVLSYCPLIQSVSCFRHLLRVLDICSLKHESSEEISKFTRVAESLKNDCYNCFSGFSEMFAAGLCSTGQVLFLSVCVCLLWRRTN